MYRHPRVTETMDKAAGVVRELFARLFEAPDLMPQEWGEDVLSMDEIRRARRIADYIAGMTDRYALAEHRRLFDRTPELR